MNEDVFDSVWDALEDSPSQAANVRARSDVLIAIQLEIERWDVTQLIAAGRLNLTQPRLNDLLRGRIDKFSLDALLVIASAAGLSVEWRIEPKAA